MASQDLIVVALVSMAVVGAFATDKSSSQTPSKASSPAKLPSSFSLASTAKFSSTKSPTPSFNKPSSSPSESDGRAPKSSPVGAQKSFSSSSSPTHSKSDNPETKEGSSFDAESLEDVLSPPSPNVTGKVLSLLQDLKNKEDVIDSESSNSNNESFAPAPFNSDTIKPIIGIVNILVVTRFFLFYAS